jgi:hypothetical protein
MNSSADEMVMAFGAGEVNTAKLSYKMSIHMLTWIAVPIPIGVIILGSGPINLG